MTHLVLEQCIKCKYTDCVEVCPVDCFYEGKNMLVIHPDECIDCGVCIAECPVDAIVADSDMENEEELIKWLEHNRQYAALWPNITEIKKAYPEAGNFKNVKNKLKNHFSPDSFKLKEEQGE